MNKSSIIAGSFGLIIVCLLVLMVFMKLEDKTKEEVSTTTTTVSTTTTTTSTSSTTTTSDTTKKTKKGSKTSATTEEIEIGTTSTTVVSKIWCDDNDKLAWGSILFAIEDGDLYIYLNDYDNKYKTTVKDVDCISFQRIPRSSFGTVKIYKGEDLVKEYNYSEFLTFDESNLEQTFGKLTKIEKE